MNGTIEIPVWGPTLIAAGGLVTGAVIMLFFDRQTLADVVSGHRQLADVDARSARWLWLHGYRSTPHAGPDVTDDMPTIEADDHVTGEVLAVMPYEVPTSDDPDAPDDDTDRAGWWRLLLALVWDLAGRVHDWIAARLKRKPEPYRGKHWVAGTQHTGAWPVVIPAQRDGGDDL